MIDAPTTVDYWCAEHLAWALGRHPTIDLAIQSAINHNVLGGLWFGLTIFVLWLGSSGPDGQTDAEVRRRVLIIFAGSMLAVLLTLVVPAWISWLPPNRTPGLSNRYPVYFTANPNVNSFPSQSVALYTAIAAGVFSLHRRLGTLLFLAVALIVALPRMYVGGHYLSDVLAGAALGLGGFGVARWLERRVQPWRRCGLPEPGVFRLLTNVVVFIWILEVSVEFRDAPWLTRVVQLVLRRSA